MVQKFRRSSLALQVPLIPVMAATFTNWSLGESRKTKESDDVIRLYGWWQFETATAIRLKSAGWIS